MRIPDGLAGTWAGPETGRPLDMGDGARRAAREKEVCPFLGLCMDRCVPPHIKGLHAKAVRAAAAMAQSSKERVGC